LVVEHEFNEERVVTHLPVIGYYPAQFSHQVPVGKLVTFKGHLNNENFSRLYREFLYEKSSTSYGFVNISMEHIVVVSYRDRKGVPGKVYFIDRELVGIESAAHRLEKHRKMFPVEIQGLTADRLMSKVLDYENSKAKPSDEFN